MKGYSPEEKSAIAVLVKHDLSMEIDHRQILEYLEECIRQHEEQGIIEYNTKHLIDGTIRLAKLNHMQESMSDKLNTIATEVKRIANTSDLMIRNRQYDELQQSVAAVEKKLHEIHGVLDALRRRPAPLFVKTDLS